MELGMTVKSTENKIYFTATYCGTENGWLSAILKPGEWMKVTATNNAFASYDAAVKHCQIMNRKIGWKDMTDWVKLAREMA